MKTLKKIRKIFSILMILCLLILGGCQKKSQGSVVKTEDGSPAKFQIWTTDYAETFEALAREFIAQAKIKNLQPQVIVFDDEENLTKTLVSSMAEGKSPDAVFVSSNWILQNPNKVFPLAGDPSLTPKIFAETFVRAANQSLTSSEAVYGIPMIADSLAVFYNYEHLVDHLEDRNRSAENWEDFEKDITKLTITDNSFERFKVSGAAIGRSDNLHYGAEILSNIMLQEEVVFFSGGDPKFHETQVIDPETKTRENPGEKALEFFTKFSAPKSVFYTWNRFLASPKSKHKEFMAFVTGKTSQIFAWARDLPKIEELIATTPKSILPENLGIGMFPQKNKTQKEIFTEISALTPPRNAPRPEISWRFLKFVMQKQNLTNFANNTQTPTARLDLLAQQAENPQLQIFARQAKFGRAFTTGSKSSFLSGIKKAIEEVSSGRIKAKEALKVIAEDLAKKIRKKREREKQIKR